MSEKGLAILGEKSVLSRLKSAHLKKCIHCLSMKQNKVSFEKVKNIEFDTFRFIWSYEDENT